MFRLPASWLTLGQGQVEVLTRVQEGQNIYRPYFSAFQTAIFGESGHDLAVNRDLNKAFVAKVDTLHFKMQNHNIKNS